MLQAYTSLRESPRGVPPPAQSLGRTPLTRFGHAHRRAPTLQAFVQRFMSSDHVAARRRGQGLQTGPPCAAAAAGLAG